MIMHIAYQTLYLSDRQGGYIMNEEFLNFLRLCSKPILESAYELIECLLGDASYTLCKFIDTNPDKIFSQILYHETDSNPVDEDTDIYFDLFSEYTKGSGFYFEVISSDNSEIDYDNMSKFYLSDFTQAWLDLAELIDEDYIPDIINITVCTITGEITIEFEKNLSNSSSRISKEKACVGAKLMKKAFLLLVPTADIVVKNDYDGQNYEIGIIATIDINNL